MNAEELRLLQAPLKALYKENPAAARATFRASGVLLPDRPVCRIETRFATIDAGLHPAAGGDGNDACSGDMMLEALVACAGVTFNVVATAMSIPFRSARVIVEGDGDFRGTLAPRMPPSASRTSACASRSTPTPPTTSWPLCCA